MTKPVLVALFVLITTSTFAQPVEQPRTISTTGEAVVYVVPDEVLVTVGVETFNANLDASKNANDAASKRLLLAIKGLGVEEQFIQTDTLQVEIRYRSSHPSEGIEGYISQRTYAVRLKDAKKLEALVDAALKNGANQLMGVQYRSSELRKHRDAARKLAIKAAKEKAAALGEELGVKIGTPRTISEGYAGSYFGGYNRSMNYNAQAQNSIQVIGGAGDESGETTPMGQIGINATVSVVFDLVP